jgi:hypothetical protein
MTDLMTQPVNETNDPSHLEYQSLIASILTGVCDALQIPRDFLEPTCSRNFDSHSALSTVASFRRYTIERQLAAKKPWPRLEVEANQPSSKGC